jgi:hypothetical protein
VALPLGPQTPRAQSHSITNNSNATFSMAISPPPAEASQVRRGPGRFSSVAVHSLDIHGNAWELETLRSSVEELGEISESLDEAVGPEQAPLLRAAARVARALPQKPFAEFRYRPVAALAAR